MTPEEFKSARKEMGLKQGPLAALLGLNSQSYVSQIETGAYGVSGTVSRLMRLYLNLHRRAPDLLPEDWPKPQS